jgi:hypothetical protein
MKNKTMLTVLLIGTLILAACASAAPTAEPTAPEEAEGAVSEDAEMGEPTAEMQDEAEAEAMEAAGPAITITADAEGYELPQAVQSGWTEVTLVNESDGQRQAAIFRLEDGNTMADLAAFLQQGVPGFPEWLTAVGGPSGIFPGAQGSVTVDLQPGDYVVLDAIPDDTGVPGLAKGYLAPFTVTEESNGMAAPEANSVLGLADYAFTVDPEALAAGSYTFEVSNSGPTESHEVAIIQLDEGASVQDFLDYLANEAPQGPPPGHGVGGTAGIAVDETAYVSLDLESGVSYGLLCFLPSGANLGAPHFALGMVSEFTVP